jgi:hypothetical protein
MSTKAGTIQGTPTGISFGAWLAAILLATLIVVSLFAVATSSGTTKPAPTTAKVETTVPVGFSHVAPTTGGQLSGGRNVTGPTSSTLPHGI